MPIRPMLRRNVPGLALLVVTAIPTWSGLVSRLPAQVSPPPTASSPERPADPARRERFEREIRPLLAENCHRCHGPSKQESGLRLDHGSLIRRGGTRGPALVPGDPDASLLLRAVGYQDPDLQMPPKNRLPATAIGKLASWIAAGAWWPDEPVPTAAPDPAASFDLEARRGDHWCWQPVERPVVPEVADSEWNRDPIDRLVRARLAAEGLPPAEPIDRSGWLRRVTFDLLGLPPTAAELEDWLADTAPGAEQRVVDRLLASPHFGERFARHWMDLVRYAETMGHEFDFPIQNAWRYRDALIRAFDQDVPYDRIILEHLAGDLLDDPRFDPATGQNDSAALTACYWFGDQTHSPVSSRQARADRVDNAVDVFSKSFLGLTVACARCHDHKFDAISTRDYYAMAGVVSSSRYLQHSLRDPEVERAAAQRLAAARDALAARVLGAADADADELARLFRATAALPAPPPPVAEEDARERQEIHHRAEVSNVAARHDVDVDALLALDAALRDAAAGGRGHPLAPWVRFREGPADAGELAGYWDRARADRPAPDGSADHRWLARFDRAIPDGLTLHGPAFGTGPLQRPVVVFHDDEGRRGGLHPAGWLDSAAIDKRLHGTAATARFDLDRRYLHLRVAGQGSRINVVLDGFNLIRNPIYGALKPYVDNPRPHWIRIDLQMWQGHAAYLQFVDQPTADPADPHRGGGYPEDGWIAVQRIALSDSAQPPADHTSDDPVLQLLGASPPQSRDHLATRYGEALAAALADVRHGIPPSGPARVLLDSCWRAGVLPPPAGPGLEPLRAAWQSARAALPEPLPGPTTTEGTGTDLRVHLRGSHRTLGDVVPRRFLSALGGAPTGGPGSGRLAMARHIVRPDNPLTARVAVNRLWHHLFGRGIVPTVDNFGELGVEPTHPELLDLLAADFVADGWSVKNMVRRLVLTRTYRCASVNTADAERADPDLVTMHRAPVRRLQGEAIRDAMLRIAGRLDPRRFGPSVPVHLTPFMDGRGRPGRSGPLDGAGRRSVYLETRRNFLNPMFLAFDTPIPFSTVGRRTISNVPAQALTLLNDPLVHELARSWAERSIREHPDPTERLTTMYRQAFARAPSPVELERTLAFVADQTRSRGVSHDDPDLWSDVAHVLFNVKEFVFLR